MLTSLLLESIHLKCQFILLKTHEKVLFNQQNQFSCKSTVLFLNSVTCTCSLHVLL